MVISCQVWCKIWVKKVGQELGHWYQILKKNPGTLISKISLCPTLKILSVCNLLHILVCVLNLVTSLRMVNFSDQQVFVVHRRRVDLGRACPRPGTFSNQPNKNLLLRKICSIRVKSELWIHVKIFARLAVPRGVRRVGGAQRVLPERHLQLCRIQLLQRAAGQPQHERRRRGVILEEPALRTQLPEVCTSLSSLSLYGGIGGGCMLGSHLTLYTQDVL